MLSAKLLSASLVIGGNGMMVPFRRLKKVQIGKYYGESKGGIFARLKRMLNCKDIQW